LDINKSNENILDMRRAAEGVRHEERPLLQLILCLCSCLLAKMPAAATQVLEAEAYDTDPAKTGLTPRDFLLYCYYGGLTHIGVLSTEDMLHTIRCMLHPP
jgi:hypothetical protein